MRHYVTIKEEIATMSFSIDASSNKDYYIILKDGKEFMSVPKRGTTLEILKKHFETEEVR